MRSGAKAAIGATVALLLAVGGELVWLHHRDNAPVKQKAATEESLPLDDLVYLKKMLPDSMKDMKAMDGKTVWVSAGGQLDYYPYAEHRVEYGKSAGTLLGAQRMILKDAVEQVAPKAATFRIPGGDRQVLEVFTLPDSGEPNKEYGVPVGYRQDGQYTMYADEIFFYDDPHVLYKHWGPEMWAHVDKHEPVLGMSENQAMMALGQTITPHGDNVGDRSVTFDNSGHPVTIDFQNNKAVKITPGD
jgi:hypothetical protein